MGTYISIGSALNYYVDKKDLKQELYNHWLKGRSDDEIKAELSKNFPKEIYSFSEDDNNYIYKVSNKVSVSDFIELYQEFNKIARRDEGDWKEITEHLESISNMPSIDDVIRYADNGKVNFWPLFLPGSRYYHQVSMFDTDLLPNTTVIGVTFYMDCGKTISEGCGKSFELFTDYLQTCLKGTRLAKTMLVFLSL